MGAWITIGTFPKPWLEQIPAVVFGCLVSGEMRLMLPAGNGHANGGVHRDVPISVIPFELRMPNALLWVTLDGEMDIAHVWIREEQEA